MQLEVEDREQQKTTASPGKIERNKEETKCAYAPKRPRMHFLEECTEIIG